MFYPLFIYFLLFLNVYTLPIDQIDYNKETEKNSCVLCKKIIQLEDSIAILHENEVLASCYFHKACLTNYFYSHTEIKTCPCGQAIHKGLLQSEPEKSSQSWHLSGGGHHQLQLSDEDYEQFKNNMLPILVGTSVLIAGGTYLLSWFI